MAGDEPKSGKSKKTAKRAGRRASSIDPSQLPAAARLHIWQIQAVRDVLFVAAMVGVVWLGYALRAVTVPLLVALLLAYLFEPLVARLSEHPRATRPMVVGGLLATVGFLVVLVLALMLPLAAGQTTAFMLDLREGRVRQTAANFVESFVPGPMQEHVDDLVNLLPEGLAPKPRRGPVAPDATPPGDGAEPSEDGAEPSEEGAEAREDGAEPPREIGPRTEEDRLRAIVREELARSGAAPRDGDRAQMWGIARGGGRAVARLLGGIVQLGFLAFLIPFYFFFFSVSYPAVASFVRSLVPEKNRPRAGELLGKMDRVVAGFVRGRIMISLIMGVMLAFGWGVFGVPYSIALGMVVGLFCAVPYLGVVGIPAAVALLAFEKLGLKPDEQLAWWGGAWWGVVLWPTLVFGVVQVVEGYLLTPLIAGKATNLDPVTILVAVLAGGSIMGVYGMLLSIPAAACLKILATDVLLPRIRAWTKGRVADPLPIDRD